MARRNAARRSNSNRAASRSSARRATRATASRRSTSSSRASRATSAERRIAARKTAAVETKTEDCSCGPECNCKFSLVGWFKNLFKKKN